MILTKFHQNRSSFLAKLALISSAFTSSCSTVNGWSSWERFPKYEGIDFTRKIPYKLSDPQLAGIIITQTGESAGKTNYLRTPSEHPAMVTFVYWSGLRRNCSYSRSGELIANNSLPPASLFCAKTDQLLPGNNVWRYVDYRWGSDPEFLHHKDPRKLD